MFFLAEYLILSVWAITASCLYLKGWYSGWLTPADLDAVLYEVLLRTGRRHPLSLCQLSAGLMDVVFSGIEATLYVALDLAVRSWLPGLVEMVVAGSCYKWS